MYAFIFIFRKEVQIQSTSDYWYSLVRRDERAKKIIVEEEKNHRTNEHVILEFTSGYHSISSVNGPINEQTFLCHFVEYTNIHSSTSAFAPTFWSLVFPYPIHHRIRLKFLMFQCFVEHRRLPRQYKRILCEHQTFGMDTSDSIFKLFVWFAYVHK